MSADTDMLNKVARAMRQAMTAVDCGGEGSEFVAFIDIEAGARAALDASGIGEMEAENERLRDVLDTERYKVAIGVQAIARAVQGRRWLSQPGRGSYAYDDERYQQEFGAALDEINAALVPLQAIAQDWSDCPRDPVRVSANRDAALSRARATVGKRLPGAEGNFDGV